VADPTTRPIVPLTLADDVVHRRLLATRVNAALTKDGTDSMTAPLRLATYVVADLPDATLWVRSIVYVSDETGGAVPAFSDGTNWRRVTDRAIVS